MAEIVILGSPQSGKTSLVVSAAYAAKKKDSSPSISSNTHVGLVFRDLSSYLARYREEVIKEGESAASGDPNYYDYSPDDLRRFFENIPPGTMHIPIPFKLFVPSRHTYELEGMLQDLPGVFVDRIADDEYRRFVDTMMADAVAVLVVVSMDEIRPGGESDRICRVLEYLSDERFSDRYFAVCLTKPDVSERKFTFRYDKVVTNSERS